MRPSSRWIGVTGLGVIALASAQALIDWGLTYPQRAFLDAFSTRDAAAVWPALRQLFILFVCLGGVAFARPILRSLWAIRLRKCRFEHLARAYFGEFRFAIGQQSQSLPEVAQRLCDDVNSWASLSAELVDGGCAAGFKFVLFGFLLWTVIPSVHVGWVTVPGPMFWFTLLSSAAMIGLIHVLGRDLPVRSSSQLEREAELRSALSQTAEHALSIALLHGGDAEARSAYARLGHACRAALGVAWVRARLGACQAIFTPSDLLVFVLLMPLYFRGMLSFGSVFQVSMAHNGAAAALGWFVAYYGEIAQFRTARNRVDAMESQLLQLAHSPRPPTSGANLDLRQMILGIPDHRAGVEPYGRQEFRALRILPAIRIEPGDRVLLVAPSGFGKSILMATLRGCWPWYSGDYSVPDRAVWIPQRPYLADGPLLAALGYPEATLPDPIRVGQLLDAVGLSYLTPRLDELATWRNTLSGGELARLGLVRAILQEPKWIFMDEPTSALDRLSAERFWNLACSLEGVTLVLIAHTVEGPYDKWRRIQLLEGASVRATRLQQAELPGG